MMSHEDINLLLASFESQYPLPKGTYIAFWQFTIFEDPKLLGRTLSFSSGRRDIYLSANRLDKDWKIKAVLWHEFCHCCLPTSEGHGMRFWRMMFRKPLLAIMDLILRATIG